MVRFPPPLLLGLLVACEAVPTLPSDIDQALATSDVGFACKGLASEDAALALYTAEKLAESGQGAACLCEAIHPAAGGVLRAELAAPLKGTKRDDVVACLAPALDDAAIDRAELAGAIGDIGGPQATQALSGALASSEPSIRASAAYALRRDPSATEALRGALGDPDAAVRTQAARALARHVEQGVIVSLGERLADEDAGVRAAAVASLASMETADGDRLACRAMMEDADLAVRSAPLPVWTAQQARRPEVIACLGQRLGRHEDDAALLGAVIGHLRLAGTVEAKGALCDAIGPFTRANVADTVPEEGGSLDVVSAQNAMAWEQTPSCVQKAYAQTGYTCAGKYWLAWWTARLGGSARAQPCPGMTAEAVSSGGSGPKEVSFE